MSNGSQQTIFVDWYNHGSASKYIKNGGQEVPAKGPPNGVVGCGGHEVSDKDPGGPGVSIRL